jgi:outer membrane protein OmpA-like peptidoglycan-associated protein
MILTEPPMTGRQNLSTPGKQSAANRVLWGVAVLGVLLALAGMLFLMNRMNHLEQQITHLSGQVEQISGDVEQTNGGLKRVAEQASTASRRAAEAETSAQQAAQQRNQAQKAQAQSQQAATVARQQAKVAQDQAAEAQKAALQYRQQRQEELNRLQQVLGQIADTRRTAMGLIMTLGNNSIRFDFDSANLHPENREILSRIAGILLTLRGYKISVFGYTDDVGSKAYNLKLSERRANTVRDYLVKAGLNPNIITAKGYGKSDPRVAGDTPAARAANRRVEIAIVDSSLEVQAVVNPGK